MIGRETEKMQESGEMYLETILVLSRRIDFVRSVDIADEMAFSRPSVSRAMSKLKEQNYILMDGDGYITLTKSGRAIAEKIYERHTVLADLLKSLGVSEAAAVADACKIEHDISDESFSAIKKAIRKK